jgi:hypothetical protein
VSIVGKIRGFHITDDARIVTKALRQGLLLDRGQDVCLSDDLFASGLYFSQAPQLWVGRSAHKWDFVERLTPKQRAAIAETIRNDNRFEGGGYLTPFTRVGMVLQEPEKRGEREEKGE